MVTVPHVVSTCAELKRVYYMLFSRSWLAIPTLTWRRRICWTPRCGRHGSASSPTAHIGEPSAWGSKFMAATGMVSTFWRPRWCIKECLAEEMQVRSPLCGNLCYYRYLLDLKLYFSIKNWASFLMIEKWIGTLFYNIQQRAFVLRRLP